jgi:hypothetical protein
MKDPTNSDLLWCKIHLAEGRLFAATDAFWTHPDIGALLPEFLVQAHRVMRCGFSLMAVARERALSQPNDPVAVDLAAYLQMHLEEELGHDQWLLDDILTLGLSAQEVLMAPPCAALVELVGAQYFWILHGHPVAIMGYLTLMEGYAPLADQLEDIRVRSGAPATAFRCLQLHAEDDPSHLADLNRTLDRMNLSVEQSRVIGLCAFSAIECIAALFEELLTNHRNRTTVRSPREPLHARA